MNMKQSISAALVTLGMASNLAFAAGPETAGSAVSMCKNQAKKAHPEYETSKATNIKQRRGVYKIKLKVRTAGGSENTYCEVDKDGNITYQKA